MLRVVVCLMARSMAQPMSLRKAVYRSSAHGLPVGSDGYMVRLALEIAVIFVHAMPMTDTLSPAQRSQRMSLIRGKDTRPELWVRRALHAQGFRFRLHRKDLPGRPDIVLPKYGVVVFVQGCFWHAHHCQKGRVPATRSEFWQAKFEGNKKRDARNMRALRQAGWRVLCVWECQLANALGRERALERLVNAIRLNS